MSKVEMILFLNWPLNCSTIQMCLKSRYFSSRWWTLPSKNEFLATFCLWRLVLPKKSNFYSHFLATPARKTGRFLCRLRTVVALVVLVSMTLPIWHRFRCYGYQVMWLDQSDRFILVMSLPLLWWPWCHHFRSSALDQSGSSIPLLWQPSLMFTPLDQSDQAVLVTSLPLLSWPWWRHRPSTNQIARKWGGNIKLWGSYSY